jgi:phage gpG-like protein
VVGTNVAYAAIHQFGGQTKPHVIRPKFKRALAFGGVVVRQVQHPGSKIPARPFLALTPEDGEDLIADAEDFLQEQINRTTQGGT